MYLQLLKDYRDVNPKAGPGAILNVDITMEEFKRLGVNIHLTSPETGNFVGEFSPEDFRFVGYTNEETQGFLTSEKLELAKNIENAAGIIILHDSETMAPNNFFAFHEYSKELEKFILEEIGEDPSDKRNNVLASFAIECSWESSVPQIHMMYSGGGTFYVWFSFKTNPFASGNCLDLSGTNIEETIQKFFRLKDKLYEQ